MDETNNLAVQLGHKTQILHGTYGLMIDCIDRALLYYNTLSVLRR
jgi:hypothetical protein